MKKLQVKYYPFKQFNLVLTANGTVPSSWSELAPKQLVAIASLINNDTNDTSFLHILTGLSKFAVKKLDEYQCFELLEAMPFMSDQKMHNEIIMQRFEIGDNIFKAPKSKLKGMTFGQFIFVESHFGSYQASLDKNELYNFIAALYRPLGEKFTEEQVARYAPSMNRLKPAQCEAIVMNYLLIKEWLSSVYPLVFIKAEEDPDKPAPKPVEYNPMAWPNVFENMVGDDIPNAEKYASIPIQTSLRNITKSIKKNLKAQRK